MRTVTRYDGPQRRVWITFRYENCMCKQCGSIFEIILDVLEDSPRAYAHCETCREYHTRSDLINGVKSATGVTPCLNPQQTHKTSS